MTDALDDYRRQTRTTERHPSEEREFVIWRLLAVLNELVVPHVVGPLDVPAYYLPADRTGVMHAHRVVVSALIGSAPCGGKLVQGFSGGAQSG